MLIKTIDYKINIGGKERIIPEITLLESNFAKGIYTIPEKEFEKVVKFVLLEIKNGVDRILVSELKFLISHTKEEELNCLLETYKDRRMDSQMSQEDSDKIRQIMFFL